MSDEPLKSENSDPGPFVEGHDPGELLNAAVEAAKSSQGAHTPPGQWEPPLPEKVSAMLPGYEVTGVLGRGGMGAVYRGTQSSLDREVAIKLLPPELGVDVEFEARFRREAKSMAKLNHPNIVQIYDFGQTEEGHHFFVMEFVDGTDLHQLIRAGQLDSEGALNAVSQICDALEYAHTEGFVHRDIKPANIFINQKGILKVGDFGLAKLVDGDDPTAATEQLGLTMTGVAMGTPHYIAPEQLSEGTHVDRRADIYSLGVMFYEMLTGEIPRGAVKPPSQKSKAVDARIDDVVFRAMESDPGERYQSALDFRTDVDVIRTTPIPVVEGDAEPIEVEREAPVELSKDRKATSRRDEPQKKKSSALIAVMIGVPLLVVIVGMVVWLTNRAQSGTPEPNPTAAASVEFPMERIEGTTWSRDDVNNSGSGPWHFSNREITVRYGTKEAETYPLISLSSTEVAFDWSDGGIRYELEFRNDYTELYRDGIAFQQLEDSSPAPLSELSTLTEWLKTNPVYTPVASSAERDVRVTTDQFAFLGEDGSVDQSYRLAVKGDHTAQFQFSSGRKVEIEFSTNFETLQRSDANKPSYRVKSESGLRYPITPSPPGRLEAMGPTVTPDLIEAAEPYSDFVQVCVGTNAQGTKIYWAALRKNGEVVFSNTVPDEQRKPLRDVALIRSDRGNGFFLIHRDGSLTVTGEAPAPPAGMKEVVDAVGGGNRIALALHPDRTVTVWGASREDWAVPEAALKDVVNISASRYGAMTVTADGALHRWGRDLPYRRVEAPAGDAFVQVMGVWTNPEDSKARTRSGKLFSMEGEPVKIADYAGDLLYGGPVFYRDRQDVWSPIAESRREFEGMQEFSRGYEVAAFVAAEKVAAMLRIVPQTKPESSTAGRLRGLYFDPDEGVIPLPIPEDWKNKNIVKIGAHNYGAVRWWAVAEDGSVLRFDGKTRTQGDFTEHGGAIILDWERNEAWVKQDGSLGASSRLLPAPEGNDFTDVKVGNSFALALRKDGTVEHWFEKGRGEEQFHPDAETFTDVVAIEASGAAGAVLKESGEVIWWDQKEGLKPVQVADGARVVELSGNHTSIMIRNSDGKVQFPGGRIWEDVSGATTALRYGHSVSALRQPDRSWFFRSIQGSEEESQMTGFLNACSEVDLANAIDVQIAADAAKQRGVLLWITPAEPMLDSRILGTEWSFFDDTGGSQGDLTITVNSGKVKWANSEVSRMLDYRVVSENEIVIDWGESDRGARFNVDQGTFEIWRIKAPEKAISGRLLQSQGETSAPSADPVTQRLTEIEEQFRESYGTEIAKEHDAAVARLDGQIVAALKREQAAAAKTADLDAVLPWNTAITRLEGGGGVPTASELKGAQLPVKLLEFYETYRRELAKLEVARDRQIIDLLEQWDGELAAYQEELTRADSIPAAVQVKEWREKFVTLESLKNEASSEKTTLGEHYQINYERWGTLKVAGTVKRGKKKLPVFQPSAEDSKDVSFVAVGYEDGGHWIAVKRDGTVFSSEEGAFAPPSELRSPRWLDVGDQAIAVKKDGTIAIWGTETWKPKQPLRDVVKAESGYDNSIALHSDGTVSVWGPLYREFQPDSDLLTDAIDVAAGSVRAWILKADGSIVGWNANGLVRPSEGNEIPFQSMKDLVSITGTHRGIIGMDTQGRFVRAKNAIATPLGPLERVFSGYMLDLGISEDGRLYFNNLGQQKIRFPDAITSALTARNVISAAGAGDGYDPDFHGFVAWVEEDSPPTPE